MRHRPSGKTLNALRDEYMTRYSAPRPAHVAAAAVAKAPVSKRAAATKRRRASAAAATPAEAESSGAARAWIDATPAALGAELGSVLSDGATSIATLRAQGGVHGNKELAHVLERKLQRTRALLLRVLAYVGTCPGTCRPRTPGGPSPDPWLTVGVHAQVSRHATVAGRECAGARARRRGARHGGARRCAGERRRREQRRVLERRTCSDAATGAGA